VIALRGFDHIVLTVANLEASREFYTRVLGMKAVLERNGRISLHFGTQKINLHGPAQEIQPRARIATVGSADVCFECEGRMNDIVASLREMGVPLELGPLTRNGARGEMESVYLRDPDGNLIELSVYGG
jgi:catechol 2,3-dioxygenase-like lactoylglutathione lyase family enzyme